MPSTSKRGLQRPLSQSIAVLVLMYGMIGCGPLGDKTPTAPPAPEKPSIRPTVGVVTTERGLLGGRLVLVSLTGERVREVTRIGPVAVRDNSPAWSPDGRWVAFSSTRSRDTLAETSLWIVEMRPGAQPRRLTKKAGSVDRDPAWTPDGRALLFSSNRAGSFDLWRLPLTDSDSGPPGAAGPPSQLTSGADHDFHPSPDPSSERIAFMRVLADGSRSQLWLHAGGRSSALTEGPADVTPAWSPDGQRIAFAAPADDAEKADGDADLFTIAPDGSQRQLLVREPLADQTGPVWSTDGRYVFCTSVFRSKESKKPVLSSIAFVDLQEPEPMLRGLHSRITAQSRMGPALGPAPLDSLQLRRNLEYKEALKRAIELELIRASEAAAGQP